MNTAEKITKWVCEQVKNANAKGVVLGLSGGLDSAVVAVLCKRAFPEDTLAVIMPCFSDEKDIRDAELIARKFRIKTKEIPLDEIFENFLSVTGEDAGKVESREVSVANIKPRLRMLTLYYFANKLNYLVVGTGNKSEIMVGYSTKYGDGGCDILPIGDLLKKDVRKLAHELEIPEEIIEKTPTAGLWKGQTDEGEMGLSYAELDDALEKIEQNKLRKVNPKILKKVQEMIRKSEHKRNLPKICILGEKQ